MYSFTCCCCCCCRIASVVSDSVRPHRRQPTRLLHHWNSPGKNTGMGCHFLHALTFISLPRRKKGTHLHSQIGNASTLPAQGKHISLYVKVQPIGNITAQPMKSPCHLLPSNELSLEQHLPTILPTFSL